MEKMDVIGLVQGNILDGNRFGNQVCLPLNIRRFPVRFAINQSDDICFIMRTCVDGCFFLILLHLYGRNIDIFLSVSPVSFVLVPCPYLRFSLVVSILFFIGYRNYCVWMILR